MSFYTSLTGLNAATTQLAVTSNNIANVATTGFKRSRADFGDIFATSPLQKASTVVGKGTALKQVSQEFSQGNIELSGNTLDLAVTGEGFFPLKSADGQDLYTRNGSFLLDDKNRVVNSAGQFLNVATVDSLGKADFESPLTPLKIDPATIGEAIATSTIDLSINFPAEGEIATFTDDLGVLRTKEFDPNDPTTYAKSSAVTIYDDNGNDFLLTVYYARTQVASADQPSNKWQSYVYLGDQLIQPALSQATSTTGEPMYVNKYGQIEPESAVPVQLRSTNETYQKFNLDDLSNPIESTPATINGAILTALQYQTGEAEVQMTIDGLDLENDSVESLLTETGDGSTTVFSVAASSGVSSVDDVFVTLDNATQTTATVLDVTVAGTPSASYDIDVVGTFGALTPALAQDELTVWQNGTQLTAGTDFTLADNVLTLTATPAAGDYIRAMRTAQMTEVTVTPGASVQATQTAVTVTGAVDGTNTSFSTSVDVSGSLSDYALNVGGELKTAPTDFSVAGTTLTFVSPPASGATISLIHRTEFTLPAGTEDPSTHSYSYVDGDGNTQTLTSSQYTVSGNTLTLNPGVTEPVTLSATARAMTLGSDIEATSDAYEVLVDGEKLTPTTDFSVSGSTLTVLRDFGASSTVNVVRKNDFQLTQAADRSFSLTMTNAPSDEEVLDVALASTSEDWLAKVGDGVDQTFTLANSVRYAADVNVLVDGEVLSSGYSISGNTLSFDTAPAVGSRIVVRPSDDRTSLAIQLREAFKLAIDVPSTIDDTNIAEQGYEITVDLSSLAGSSHTGKTLAADITRELNSQLGSRSFFDLSGDASLGRLTVAAASQGILDSESIDLDVASYLTTADASVDLSTITGEEFAAAMQGQLNADTALDGITFSVDYSLADKAFQVFRSDGASLTLEATIDSNAVATNNSLFGLTGSVDRTIDPNTGMFVSTSAYDVYPNGDPMIPETVQRYGVKVEYDEATNQFAIMSGTTGDTSNIRMYDVNEAVQEMLGFVTSQTTFDGADLAVNSKETTDLAERGLVSAPAQVFGNPLSVNVASTFEVNDLSNEFSVTVDNVTETFAIPEGTYNLNEFMSTLERRINAMADTDGRTVNGVSVGYDPTTEGLVFTSGTTGNESFLQVSGSSRWGLLNLDPGLGSTSTFIEPETFASANDLPAEVYVRFNNTTGRWEEYSASPDLNMLELTESQQFDQTRQPQWRPLFLDKGELTFDTSGNLVSPLTGVELDNVVIGGSGNSLQIDINYTGSTQFTGEFSVNAQSQNGQPNGNLVGLDIGDDGLVTASYSNGSQQLKGKIILANFSTPNGLRQLGDSTFLESAESGAATLAEPGSAGVGTIRAGARERANLDLTSELVDLITAQRNFQANAKGLETSTTLTQTIINIRG
jgi:flagellar hook protein FlgE